MICPQFIHVNMGSSGGGTIRGLFSPDHFADRIKWIDTSPHKTLKLSIEAAGNRPIPSFTFVRNPWDWYISWWIIELRKHRWRGTFRNWFWHRHGTGLRYGDMWRIYTEPGCTYVGRFENMEADLRWILEQVGVIPGIIKPDEYHEAFPKAGRTYPGRHWIEGFEQWLRPDMFDYDMQKEILEKDGDVILKYGYEFDQHYYHPNGVPPSYHPGVKELTWESERDLASWAEWAPGPPGVFVNS